MQATTKSPVGLILIILVLVGLFFLALSTVVPTIGSISLGSGGTTTYDPDVMAEEVTSIISAGYQVDVEVTSNHMALHNTGSDALRCLTNKGNVATFSERSSRRLHLLCWDKSTGTLYDVIINRLNYYVDKWSNPKSQLVTAYAPEGVQGASMLEKSTYYINHLLDTVGGKVVNLQFGPGEIMFIPK